MTSSPEGEVVTPDVRIAEISARYGEDSPVGRFIKVADPELKAATERVARLRTASELVAASERPP